MPCERRDLLRTAAPTLAAALAGCAGATTEPFDPDPPNDDSTGSPAVRVSGESGVGEPIRILLDGFAPRSRLVVRANATDARGVDFSAEWSRLTDGDGTATVAGPPESSETPATPDGTTAGTPAGTTTQTPTEATQRVSAMGPGLAEADRPGIEMLLQQLTPVEDSPTPSNFVVGEQTSVDVRLTARTTDGQRASTTATRTYASAVARRPIHKSDRVESDHSDSNRTNSTRADPASNLVGWLYSPPGDGPHPGLVALHGSQAIVPHELSRSLATHGYATLALQYVGADGLPESLEGVPLEYFERATRWLTDREGVRDGVVGFVGISRGVEAALLSAAAFSGSSAVIGYSGGGVVGPGVNRSANAVDTWAAAWTRDGEPIVGADPIRSVFSAVESVRYVCSGADCVPAVRDRASGASLRRALAPAEKVEGPVLLLAGGRDNNWPASALAALTADRLERRGHDGPYQLRTYEDAGHVFGLPYQSYAGEATGPKYGGSPAANAFAAADSWPLALRYLRAGLARDHS